MLFRFIAMAALLVSTVAAQDTQSIPPNRLAGVDHPNLFSAEEMRERQEEAPAPAPAPDPAAPSAEPAPTSPTDPEPAPSPAPPPDGTLTQTALDCEWMQVYRYDSSVDEDSGTCSTLVDPCWYYSIASAIATTIRGRAEAYDLDLWKSAATASAAAGDAILHVVRTDNTSCTSKFSVVMKVQFRAGAKIDGPASAEAAGYQDLLATGARIEATAAGSVRVDSGSSPSGVTITIGPLRVTPTVRSSGEIESVFIDQDAGAFAASSEIFMLTGAVSVAASANHTFLLGVAEGESFVDDPVTLLDVEAHCAAPCSGAIHVTQE